MNKLTLTNDLANAIIDMDDIGFSESLGPETEPRSLAWHNLLEVAEKVSGRDSYRTDFRRCRKKLLDKAKQP